MRHVTARVSRGFITDISANNRFEGSNIESGCLKGIRFFCAYGKEMNIMVDKSYMLRFFTYICIDLFEKSMKKIVFAACAVAALAMFAACSKDDKSEDPAGTVMLNMHNESNGKTMLEGAIYIDDSNNFVGSGNCLLMSVGKVDGVGGIGFTSIGHLTDQIAVRNGYGYVAFRPNALMEFPSGKYALRAGSTEVNYLKIYVVSSLKKNDEVVGAAVTYAAVTPARYGLPEFGSEVIRLSSYTDSSASLTFSSADFEYDFDDAASQFKVRKDGNKLIFSPADYTYSYSGSYPLFVRIRESYTKVYVAVD